MRDGYDARWNSRDNTNTEGSSDHAVFWVVTGLHSLGLYMGRERGVVSGPLQCLGKRVDSDINIYF